MNVQDDAFISKKLFDPNSIVSKEFKVQKDFFSDRLNQQFSSNEVKNEKANQQIEFERIDMKKVGKMNSKNLNSESKLSHLNKDIFEPPELKISESQKRFKSYLQQTTFNQKDYQIPGKDIEYTDFMRNEVERDKQKMLLKKEKDKNTLPENEPNKIFNQEYFQETRNPNKLRKGQRIFQENSLLEDLTRTERKKLYLTANSTVWLFIIANINPDLHKKLIKLYTPYTDRGYEMPLCHSVDLAHKYLSAKSSRFKIVVDVESYDELKKNIFQKNYINRVESILLYTNGLPNGIEKAIQLKEREKKFKKLYGWRPDITSLLKQVELNMDGNKFVKQNDEILQVKSANKLPAFLMLSGEDKTEITNYRICLYGAIKLEDKDERMEKLSEFEDIVRMLFDKDPKEMEHLERYLKIDHFSIDLNNQEKHKAVLNFYADDTFYYKILNGRLRISRTVDQIRPLMLPFSENYHAVKYFHNVTLKKRNLMIPQYRLFRGAAVRPADFKILKKGAYIELLGFVSTSRSEKHAREKFIRDSGDCLFIFVIKPIQLTEETLKLDHGFVELSQFQIAPKKFEQEQEVLLNALNIYKVTDVIPESESEDGVPVITLQYGAILQLYQKDKSQRTPIEEEVIQNYRFCIKALDSIEDQGDIFKHAQEFDKCKDFCLDQVEKNPTIKNFTKLAEAQLYCGQTDQAWHNTINSLNTYLNEEQKYKQMDRVMCMKIFEIHQKNADILLQREDTLHAAQTINCQLNLIDDEKDWFLKAQKLRERAQISFKQGKIIESQNDLKASEDILVTKKMSFSIQRKQIENKYFWKYLIGCCCLVDQVQLNQQKLKEYEFLDVAEKEVLQMAIKIQELLVRINESVMSLAEFVGDKKMYERSVEKGRQYFEELKKTDRQDPFEVAKLKVIEAKIQNSLQSLQHIQKSYELMNESIEAIEEISPMNRKVAEYRTILGKFKSKQYKERLNLPKRKSPNSGSQQRQQFGGQEYESQTQERYDYEEQEENYREVQRNYQKALAVTMHNEPEDHPKVLQVRNLIGELEYEHSKLKQGRDQADNILGNNSAQRHSEGAKAALLLAKIYLARGELKTAFINIQHSHSILHTAVVKQPSNPAYQTLFQIHPLYIEIELWRCKVYNRQMNHQLALQKIIKLEKIAVRKLTNVDGVGYLADIYEEMGNILVYQQDRVKFEDCYLKAIKLRECEMGRYNITNATLYCALCKYLMFLSDLETAQKYLRDSLDIFTMFPSDHPNWWVQLSSFGYLEEKRKNYPNQVKWFKNALNLIEKRYSKNHISYLKLKVKYAQSLELNHNFQEAIREFEISGSLVEDNLKETRLNATQLMESDANDDEKLLLKLKIEKELKETQEKYLKLTSDTIKFTNALLEKDNKILNEGEYPPASLENFLISSDFPTKNDSNETFFPEDWMKSHSKEMALTPQKNKKKQEKVKKQRKADDFTPLNSNDTSGLKLIEETLKQK